MDNFNIDAIINADMMFIFVLLLFVHIVTFSRVQALVKLGTCIAAKKK